jgi:4-nitrophenyl phosphatase
MSYGDKAIMFDMDGVLYRGTSGLPHAGEAVEWARRQGFKLGFITNNSTRTAQTFHDRLAKYGIKVELEEIITSALATAEYIKTTYGTVGRAFIIGLEGIREALEGVGIEVVNLDDSHECDYVVVGMSPEFNYQQLVRAQQEILVNGARFIGTNGDRTYPWDDGTVRPGGGTMVAAVQACTYVEPVIIGKPNLYMLEQLAGRYGVNPPDCLVVGDRLDTDIVSGNRFGAHTMLILTGISTREEAEGAKDEYLPDFILDSLHGFEKAVESVWK